MDKGMLGVLVLAGVCRFASSLHHHQYHIINEPKTWPEALQYCRDEHTDLATVDNMAGLRKLAHLIKPNKPFAFLGLYRKWSWSLSDADDYKEGEPFYGNWASGQPKTHYCGSIRVSGEWFAADCNDRLKFFCYNASTTDISQRFTLGEGSMNWFEAQAYCRNRHTDLARVRNQLENEALQRTVDNSNNGVWIGLAWMSWAWSDGSEPSFVPWSKLEPQIDGFGDCGTLDVNSNPLGLIDKGCNERAPFLCYSGPLRKHLIVLKLTAEDSSVDTTSPVVMESILKWVKKKLTDEGVDEDVKLSWSNLSEKKIKT